jgi:arylformamidase
MPEKGRPIYLDYD